MFSAPSARGTTVNMAVPDLWPAGFSRITAMFIAADTSKEVSAVVQSDAELHSVFLAFPLIRICDPGPGLDAMKLAPCTRNVNPAAPAVVLDGKRDRIVGRVVIVTAAEAVLVVSSALVARMLTIFGEGAIAGAKYSPLASMAPQRAGAPAQPGPVTFHVICWLSVPATAAVNI